MRQAEQLAGIGPVTASAVIATVGDFKQFRNGSQFGAWLGLTPKQNSSGGKNNLSSYHFAFNDLDIMIMPNPSGVRHEEFDPLR